MIRYRCAALSLLLLATACWPAQAQTLRGEWCGIATQDGPGDRRTQWNAKLTLDGAAGRMDYPSLGCGGPLTFEGMKGQAHLYRERITYGVGTCIDNGLISVEARENSVYWEWTGSGAVATATLAPGCGSAEIEAPLKTADTRN